MRDTKTKRILWPKKWPPARFWARNALTGHSSFKDIIAISNSAKFHPKIRWNKGSNLRVKFVFYTTAIKMTLEIKWSLVWHVNSVITLNSLVLVNVFVFAILNATAFTKIHLHWQMTMLLVVQWVLVKSD